MKALAAFFVIFGLTFFIIVGASVAVKHIQFNQDCGGYLERAANANTIPMAITELEKAVKYMEEHDLTEGYTSVFYKTPDEDIGFWYNNCKSSLNELKSLSDSSAPLEKSNMLMKLRETLLDNGKNGTSLTVPEGISRYPNNVMWEVLSVLSLLGLVCVWFGGLYIINNWY